MWLTDDDVANAWSGFKGFMGDAWHHGTKVLGTVDRVANLGMRLLGAAGHTGLLRGRALESGLQAADKYGQLRNDAMKFGQDVSKTVDHFRQAAPELRL